MVVGISVFELHIPGAQSLKHKRKVVRGLIDRIHSRYRVSIAETDHHDLHQRSEIGLAIVSGSRQELDRLLDGIRRLVDEIDHEAVLTRWEPEILEQMP